MEWIKVSERLPDPLPGSDTSPLVLIRQSEDSPRCSTAPQIWIGYYWHDEKYGGWKTYQLDLEEVTHWMPLPELPKE